MQQEIGLVDQLRERQIAFIHLIEQAAIGLNQELRRIVIDTRSVRPARHGQETILYEANLLACGRSEGITGHSATWTTPRKCRGGTPR